MDLRDFKEDQNTKLSVEGSCISYLSFGIFFLNFFFIITLSAPSFFPFSVSQYAFPHHLLLKKLSPSLSLWCLLVRSVVRGLLFSQVGEGHVLQMDMSCGAMPSQLHWREPSGSSAEQPGRHWERGGLSLVRQARMLPGPSWIHGRDGQRETKRWWERTERESGGRVVLLLMVLANKCTLLH